MVRAFAFLRFSGACRCRNASGALSRAAAFVNQGGMFSNQLREDLRNFFRLNGRYLHTYASIM